MIKSVMNWDQYFMAVSKLSALRSKDPSTKVGACIVNSRKRIVSIGYNGLTAGMVDEEFHWTKRDGNYEDTKYPYIMHAEANAIVSSGKNLVGCALYVSLFPCNECAKLIVQAGITQVVYESNKYADQAIYKISKKLLLTAGVELKQLDKEVKIDVHVV